MMLGVSRSLGDFYHQRYGVTWEPEVVVHDIATYCAGAPLAMINISSDGVWDHWTFEDAMAEVAPRGAEPPSRQAVLDFFEATRYKGEEAFGDHADNLTGVIIALPNPAL